MIKCRVHIYNEKEKFDERVYVDITLPCLPPLNSCIHLGEDTSKELDKAAKEEAWIAEKYFPKQFPYEKYARKGIEDFKEEYLQDLRFRTYGYVFDLIFKANVDYVSIELTQLPIERRKNHENS